MPIRGSQPRPQRLTTRGAATRARILDAAADLVYRYGVGSTSLDDIMSESGTSKSQLYHYFADKDALIREVITTQTRRVLVGQEPELHRLDSMAGLRRWRDAMVKRTKATKGIGGCPIGSLASELADQSDETRELLAHCFKEWESHFADGFRSMRDRGELDERSSPEELATTIMAAIQGGLLLAQTTQSSRPLELALDMAIRHVAAQRREPAGRPRSDKG